MPAALYVRVRVHINAAHANAHVLFEQKLVLSSKVEIVWVATCSAMFCVKNGVCRSVYFLSHTTAHLVTDTTSPKPAFRWPCKVAIGGEPGACKATTCSTMPRIRMLRRKKVMMVKKKSKRIVLEHAQHKLAV